MKTKIYCAYILLAIAAQLLIGCSSGDLAQLLGGGGSTGGTSKTLVVGDRFNSRVLLFNLPVSNGESATVVLGEPDFTTTTGGSSATTLSGVNVGRADGSGNIWVVDTDNNRVLEFKPPFSNGMAASLVIGQADMTSSGSGLSATQLESPVGATFDSAGDLWVSDQDNSRIVEFKPPFSDGMAASVAIGEPDLVTKGCNATATGLCFPDRGIAFDPSGDLWVSDSNNCRILEYKPPFASGMAASVALGAADTGHSGCAAPVSATSNSGVIGIVFDTSGNLWAADDNNGRVLEFKPPFSNGMAASLVLGQPNFTSSTLAATQAGMWNPVDVAFDSSGNLYVADMGNARITIYNPPFANGMNANVVLGQPDFTSRIFNPAAATNFSASGVATMK